MKENCDENSKIALADMETEAGETGQNTEEKHNIAGEDEKEDSNIVQVFKALERIQPCNVPRFAPTDVGSANLFADVYFHKLRYVPERKMWYCYSGKAWEPDLCGLQAMELCKDLAQALYTHVVRLDDRTPMSNGGRQQLVHWADKWRQRLFREKVLKDAMGVYTQKLSDFDSSPWLFNCRNGTLDLRDGSIRPHDSNDLLATISGTDYDKEAHSELWENTVSEAMQGDGELISYLQKALGYGLTGDTSEECFFLLYGPTTRNGKGTIMETYMKMLGAYGRAARPETIAIRQYANSAGPSEDIAKLSGARAVNIAEPDRQLVLSSAVVKALTGNDTITARFLNENSFEFRPQFKLFINTNHLPKANDVTIFNSGRVKVLPFNRHFSPEEQDKTLKRRLAQELPGVLNWCLEGLRRMREEGFGAPEAVQDATAKYRQDSDKMGRFVEECLVADPQGEVKTAEVYTVYRDWCNDNGYKVDSMPNFKQMLETVGEVRKKRPTGGGKGSTKYSYLVNYQLSDCVSERLT